MPAARSWDIFCRVVDNYGDVGVCWRLARALAAPSGARVRLWVDDLASLQRLVPAACPDADVQAAHGIEIHRWTAYFPDVAPAEVCIEGFGCGLPERYIAAMAARRPGTLWIVLEYLSAEPWVRAHHALPSPHPRWPVQRYFFFPGFEPGTGGVLREPDLLARRAAHDAAACAEYWEALGYGPAPPGTTVVSVFAYPYAPLPALVAHWAQGEGDWVVAVPEGRLALAAARAFGCAQAAPGTSARRGRVELRVLPFVAQEHYDAGLWSADCVFVRGEDSFVRAQWAQRPFVWHIYPQEERAHWRKLDAFLDLYVAGLAAPAAGALRRFWHAWNQLEADPVTVGSAWDGYWAQRDLLAAHARTWAQRLVQTGDLAENLAQFCRDKLK